jgi:3-hydroxyisobutyrate dehydrogenase-like beta-hydroxyacid dehydrogenase
VPEVGRLVAGSDILITVLPGPGEVRELMLGMGGAAAALRPGTTWIDMTSNSPNAITEIRNALLDYGIQVLDAPAGGAWPPRGTENYWGILGSPAGSAMSAGTARGTPPSC